MARKRHDHAALGSLDENTLNLLELTVFVEETTDFRLGLATYDVPETRDTYLHRLTEAVADRPVHLTQLDLTRSSGEESLLKRLREHLQAHSAPDGKHPAVMVVGLEAAIDFRRTPDGHQARGGPLLHNANLRRDAFPRLCPAPVVLWLSPFATTAFAQAAPDLWHWRSGSFTFTGSPEARRRFEKELITTPLLKMDRLAAERKRERLGLLRDLLAELEMAEDRETPGNRTRRAAILQEIGLTCSSISEIDAARESFDEAVRLYREIGDRRGEGNALGNLGLAYADLGQMERAIGILEQALRIGQEIKDPRIIQFTSDPLERLRGDGSAGNSENG